jgi:hypothetical protein
MISEKGLLFIEPAQPPSAAPVIDHLTRRVCAAFRKARRANAYLGAHACSCGAYSTNLDYLLPNGDVTHSLCVHYAGHHRSEIPPRQLAKIGALTFGEEEPNEEELFGPELVLAKVRAIVEQRLKAFDGEQVSTFTSWGLDLEALSRGLQDSWLRRLTGVPTVGAESEKLASFLRAIGTKALPYIKAAVEEEHGDVRRWGERALQTPGWSREVWVSPLVAVMQRLRGNERRIVAEALSGLGVLDEGEAQGLMKLVRRENAFANGVCPQCHASMSPCRDARLGWFCARCGIIPPEENEPSWELACNRLTEKARGSAG